MRKVGMFLMIFSIVLVGMILCQMIAALIYGMRDGSALQRIGEIPYVADAVISCILSLFMFIRIFIQRK